MGAEAGKTVYIFWYIVSDGEGDLRLEMLTVAR